MALGPSPWHILQELEKNIYELRGVAGIINNLENNSSTATYFDNMMYVLSTKLYEIADNLERIDKEKKK